jgi:RNA polymerase sigma-70 factor (ECF subfamily)
MIAIHKSTCGFFLGASVLVGLAMAIGAGAQSSGKSGNSSDMSEALSANGLPRIVATSPVYGATDVDPKTTEITVTFDRDMEEGMSWTGSGTVFPQSPEGGKAHWIDKRTCVLPVKLFSAHFYRVGINSKSYQNFRSEAGVPADPSAIYFTTQGASAALKRMVLVPRIVSMAPANGAADVSPNLKELRVTFDVPMGGGFSWCGGGEHFPNCPEGKRPAWSADHKTCTFPVALKPGWDYALSLNAPSFKNFSSAGGVPLEPVAYTFKTAEK